MMQHELNPSKNWRSYALFSLAVIPLLLIFGKQNTNDLSTFFPTEDQKHILVFFDRNATLDELESVRPEIEAAGLEYTIENNSSYPNGQIRTIEVGLYKKGRGGGMVDFQPLGEDNGVETNHFCYTNDDNFSFGGLYLERIEKYLKNPEQISIHSFGLKVSIMETLAIARKEAEVRKKEKEAYILANNYRGKAQ